MLQLFNGDVRAFPACGATVSQKKRKARFDGKFYRNFVKTHSRVNSDFLKPHGAMNKLTTLKKSK